MRSDCVAVSIDGSSWMEPRTIPTATAPATATIGRRLQRQQAIEQQVERMELAELCLAVQVEPREDRRRPQQRVPCRERALVDVAHRQVEPRQVVVDENLPGEERPGQRQQQREA